ncbi:hypothetical protein [Okeania sp. SIO2B3]|uniref:hypothetical protein n=1 Tax=Okeania sp. SIO2B3 TaxID=2607784 RepID=UPI0013BF2E26|nr:hypothetical protein [Okeania sp. SIO2B3]NET42599.1 hypothetical protein [Okeania sp. SIO2B3]
MCNRNFDFTSNELENIVSEFNNCTLPKSNWTHAAHLIVALWYLTNYSELEAINNLRDRIKKYNVAVGTQNTKNSGYHETITLFWVKMIQKYLTTNSANNSFAENANNLVNLYENSALPFEYYSREFLMSESARKNWVEPDL